MKEKKRQIDKTVAQWTDGLKAIDEAVIENAETHHIVPDEFNQFVRIQIKDD